VTTAQSEAVAARDAVTASRPPEARGTLRLRPIHEARDESKWHNASCGPSRHARKLRNNPGSDERSQDGCQDAKRATSSGHQGPVRRPRLTRLHRRLTHKPRSGPILIPLDRHSSLLGTRLRIYWAITSMTSPHAGFPVQVRAIQESCATVVDESVSNVCTWASVPSAPSWSDTETEAR
jgi:hypothetical protein